MSKMLTILSTAFALSACDLSHQTSQNSPSMVAGATTAQYQQDAFSAEPTPTESVGQVMLQEAIKTLGAAIRGGIALAIDQKFNQNSNGPFDPYPYPLD